MTQDNGSRALAELRDLVTHGGLYLSQTNRDRLLAAADKIEAAIRLPDAAELDRLRRIEAAAGALLTAVENASIESLLDSEDGAEVPDWQERLWDAADTYTLAAEGSARDGG